jgi:hypothetical protein
MVAFACMAIRSDRQVQGDAITGLRTRPRPRAVARETNLASEKLPVDTKWPTWIQNCAYPYNAVRSAISLRHSPSNAVAARNCLADNAA